MKITKEKIKSFIKSAIEFLLNPAFVLCFGVAWIITNGWSYISFAIGTYFGIGWLTAVAAAYMAVLWFPFTPEKIITVTISIFLLKFFFPNDKRTLKRLYDLRDSIKDKSKKLKEKRKLKKEAKKNNKASR